MKLKINLYFVDGKKIVSEESSQGKERSWMLNVILMDFRTLTKIQKDSGLGVNEALAKNKMAKGECRYGYFQDVWLVQRSCPY